MNFLKRYGKVIMAVASALLMLVFLVPAGLKSAMSGRNQVVGYIGNEKLYGIESYNAKQAWDFLSRQPVDYIGHTLAYQLFADPMLFRSGYPDAVAADAVAQISQHDDLFALLIKEAQRMGVVVTQDDVETALRNDLPPSFADSEHADDYRAAIADALMVRKAFDRVSSVIKISQPMRQHDLAKMLQQISVNLVEFDASKFKNKVAAPTAEQLKQQYEKYRQVMPGTATQSDPFHFGYKYPDRVKLQYIEVPRSQVRQVVETSKTEHRWEVDSYKYWVQHQDQFATTRPAASQPAHKNSLSLETSAASTQPTTRPFPQVADQIKQQLIDQGTTKLQMQVFEKISAALGGDYMAFHSASPAGTTQPTSAPSSMGAPYNTFAYLQALAKQIQSEDGVLPVVVSINDHFVSLREAMDLPGIGRATIGRENLGSYLESSVAAFNPAGQGGGDKLDDWQPSTALKDDQDNLFILRVTAAEAAHAPASIEEVQNQVRQDWIKKQAYDLAREAADKLLAEAKVGGLRPAARQDGLAVVTTGAFLDRANSDVPNYNLPANAKRAFVDGCFELLSTPRVQPGLLPLRLVEMAPAGLVDVTELVSVSPIYNAESQRLWTTEADRAAVQGQLAQFGQDWFDYGSVVSRLDYRPVEQNQSNPESQQPSPAAQPVF